jgi:NhaP-type Na+/H+ or K+/H+ antiporter
MGWRAWVLPLAAIGVIGQAGIINSFSHLHTPLLYTLWRTVNALAVGSVLGLAGIWILGAVTARAGPRVLHPGTASGVGRHPRTRRAR